MSCNTNQENGERTDGSDKNNSDNTSETSATKKPLTFKDWKNLKDSQHKPNEKSKPKNKTKICNKNNNNGNVNRSTFNNNGFNGGNGFKSPIGGNFFATNNRLPGFTTSNNFNSLNNFNNNFPMRGNNYGFNNQNGVGFNNFNGPNNFNRANNFAANSFNNSPNNFGNGRNRFNGPNNGSNLELPDNFFASDGMYRQKDLMQKPLPPSCNPFRDDQKAEQLLQEFDKSRYNKDDKKKKKSNKKPCEGKKSNVPQNQQMGNSVNNNIKVNNEPKVYVPNPKANIDGKPYIPKPKLPEENLEISKEQKKQQWKEYREAMKPFKNREFYNAKRVVQRLGKKAPSELDEKQLIRLANAREIMAAHKARLTAKYGTYIKANDNSNELGELYVLNKKPAKTATGYFTRPVGKEFQNYGNFGENYTNEDHESGRKILGGYSGFPGFVSGGMLEGTATSLYTQ